MRIVGHYVNTTWVIFVLYLVLCFFINAFNVWILIPPPDSLHPSDRRMALVMAGHITNGGDLVHMAVEGAIHHPTHPQQEIRTMHVRTMELLPDLMALEAIVLAGLTTGGQDLHMGEIANPSTIPHAIRRWIADTFPGRRALLVLEVTLDLHCPRSIKTYHPFPTCHQTNQSNLSTSP